MQATATRASAIDIQHVRKQFPGAPTAAIEDCSLAVPSGDLTVLLGPSGCGKTTLLKLINRLYEPDSGRVLVNGVDTSALPATALRRGIGYVIQQVGLFPHLRVEQNIAIVPELVGWPRTLIEARIDELLDLVRLPRTYRRRYPRQLSGGEQQRVGLARALAADPKIMLMDEPFAALDAITRSRLQDELRAIHEQLRKTIVFVTHDVEEALRLADHIAVMRSGRIVQQGTPLGVISHPRDAFVRQLLTSDDVLRQLSLIPVATVMSSSPGRIPLEAPSVRVTDNLRMALSALLQQDGPALVVIDASGRSVGQLAFEDVRRAVINSRTGVPA